MQLINTRQKVVSRRKPSFHAPICVDAGKLGQSSHQGEIDLRLALRRSLINRRLEMGILWTIVIGFIAGVLAKLITPGDNEPSGFILTTILGIVGAFVATYLGQALGWYNAGEGAGLVGATVGAIVVLLVWGAIARRRSTLS
jgi:uncharacterized membrane protein YeaQ/YmgE (transglycosylase-associated protein family)